MGARNYANERRAFWPGKRVVRRGFTLLGFLGSDIPHPVVSRCMCKRLCTGGIPLLKHLL
jgi:hypothetical protein